MEPQVACTMYCTLHFFFFFQAEDGIRDDLVTGVQTCALPIYPVSDLAILKARGGVNIPNHDIAQLADVSPAVGEKLHFVGHRSEERRVGKECRSRWSPYH